MPPRVPLLTLIIDAQGEHRRIEIFDWRTVIGRSSKNDVQIVAKQVSKIHASVEIDDGIPYVRDLGSRNGVQVNGVDIGRSRQLGPGDVISIGEAQLLVDGNSILFQPAAAQTALQNLLDQEAKIRRRRRTENRKAASREGGTVNESIETTRQAAVLIGEPLGFSSGARAVVRLLRIADDFGPRTIARIEPFLLQTELGHRVWIRPLRDVELANIDAFPEAQDFWVDEPEDFHRASGQILQRRHLYLPAPLKVVSVTETLPTPDGKPVFSEASAAQPIVLSPA